MSKIEVERTVQAVKEYLNNISDSDLLHIYNAVHQELGYGDDEIYINDEEFFKMYFENNVWEAIQRIHFGDWEYSDDYVKFNGYGNIVSFRNISDEISIDELAQNVIDNIDDLIRYNNWIFNDVEFIDEIDRDWTWTTIKVGNAQKIYELWKKISDENVFVAFKDFDEIEICYDDNVYSEEDAIQYVKDLAYSAHIDTQIENENS